MVPIGATLAKVLTEWRLATGGEGQLFKPLKGRPGAPPRFLGIHNVHAALGEALEG